jgi:hypothetical protein
MAAVRRTNNRLASLLVLGAVALSGCSTTQGLSGLEQPGYQKDGSYVLTTQEQGMGCRELQERSLGLQEQMQKLSVSALKQVQEVPNTVAAAWGRMFGDPGDGVPAIAQYKEAQAESAALNATLTRKGCAPPTTASIRR